MSRHPIDGIGHSLDGHCLTVPMPANLQLSRAVISTKMQVFLSIWLRGGASPDLC
jgi:hypothetical protein